MFDPKFLWKGVATGGGEGYSNIKKVGCSSSRLGVNVRFSVSLRELRKNHQYFLAFKISSRVAREKM